VLPDDVALFVHEVERPGAAFEDRLQPTSLGELRHLRSRLSEKIEDEWRQHGITASPMRLHMVLEEALYNAWHHGNRRSSEKGITVRRGYGNDARIEVLDEGDGFAWEQVLDPTSYENRTKPSGRGLFMIRRFADEVRWSDSGRHITLFFGDERNFAPPGGRSPMPRIDLWHSPHVPSATQKIP
jgi:anti-sigma regulatory factor (Ser/Thr protein kinase)